MPKDISKFNSEFNTKINEATLDDTLSEIEELAYKMLYLQDEIYEIGQIKNDLTEEFEQSLHFAAFIINSVPALSFVMAVKALPLLHNLNERLEERFEYLTDNEAEFQEIIGQMYHETQNKIDRLKSAPDLTPKANAVIHSFENNLYTDFITDMTSPPETPEAQNTSIIPLPPQPRG